MGLIANIIHQEDEGKTLRLNATEFFDTQKKSKIVYLPSEWALQSGVQLTWPHEETDWAYMLDEVKDCYRHLAQEIAAREPLLIVTPDIEATKAELTEWFQADTLPLGKTPEELMQNIRFFECPTNDTWARDHGFITLKTEEEAQLVDFRFNGWGQKFAANYDNQICRKLVNSDLLNGRYLNCLDFVLEGGSIESDGCGTLLTTTECLTAPNRNEPMAKEEIDSYLTKLFNLKQILWLDYGYLAGDDTDSHVDTLARLCPDDTITYVQCLDKEDEHYEQLHLMEEQLKTFRTLDGKPYRLLPLPMASAVYDEDDLRLPATYANFLIMNQAVLYPTYNQPENDAKAKAGLQQAFPTHDIVGVDCRALIKQHGSLHCVTMQFPVGVLK